MSDRTPELLELLRARGWEKDENGDYVRGAYYVALLPRGIVHVGQRPLQPERADTNRWGQSRTIAEALVWVAEHSDDEA